MQNYKMVVAYDGTDFHGWQQQPKKVTIQSSLKKSFEKAFNSPANIIAASRTDSGVHAIGQIVRLKTNLIINADKLKLIWNRMLPKSIFIRNIKKIDNNFHPIFNVDHKIYYYHLFLKEPLPFIARYGWYYKFINKVDLKKLNEALKIYLGSHDFSSFCKQEKNNKKNTIKKIDEIKINKINKFNLLQIEIKGRSFLRFQIRRMVGYALDVARQPKLSLNYLEYILKNPNPKQTLLKAAACGLCLRRIIYKNEFKI